MKIHVQISWVGQSTSLAWDRQANFQFRQVHFSSLTDLLKRWWVFVTDRHFYVNQTPIKKWWFFVTDRHFIVTNGGGPNWHFRFLDSNWISVRCISSTAIGTYVNCLTMLVACLKILCDQINDTRLGRYFWHRCLQWLWWQGRLQHIFEVVEEYNADDKEMMVMTRW